jgi:hypothetical protein
MKSCFEGGGMDYREAGRKALSEIWEGRMKDRIDRYWEERGKRGEEDRC